MQSPSTAVRAKALGCILLAGVPGCAGPQKADTASCHALGQSQTRPYVLYIHCDVDCEHVKPATKGTARYAIIKRECEGHEPPWMS